MKKQIALIVLAFVTGLALEHVRVNNFDTWWSVCYQWKGPGPAQYDMGPPYSTVQRVSETTFNVVPLRAATTRVLLQIKPSGTADLYGHDGKLAAILHSDGFVEYRVDHNTVVHMLADLACYIANTKYKRWPDAVREFSKEEWK